MTVDITKETFEETIKNNTIVLVEIFAPWCGHCRQFTPVFKAVSENHPDIIFGMINTDEQPDLTKQLGVRGVPTVMGFINGIRVHSNSGMMSAHQLGEFLDKVREHKIEDISVLDDPQA